MLVLPNRPRRFWLAFTLILVIAGGAAILLPPTLTPAANAGSTVVGLLLGGLSLTLAHDSRHLAKVSLRFC
jgi:hypothetical protein